MIARSRGSGALMHLGYAASLSRYIVGGRWTGRCRRCHRYQRNHNLDVIKRSFTIVSPWTYPETEPSPYRPETRTPRIRYVPLSAKQPSTSRGESVPSQTPLPNTDMKALWKQFNPSPIELEAMRDKYMVRTLVDSFELKFRRISRSTQWLDWEMKLLVLEARMPLLEEEIRLIELDIQKFIRKARRAKPVKSQRPRPRPRLTPTSTSRSTVPGLGAGTRTTDVEALSVRQQALSNEIDKLSQEIDPEYFEARISARRKIDKILAADDAIGTNYEFFVQLCNKAAKDINEVGDLIHRLSMDSRLPPNRLKVYRRFSARSRRVGVDFLTALHYFRRHHLRRHVRDVGFVDAQRHNLLYADIWKYRVGSLKCSAEDSEGEYHISDKSSVVNVIQPLRMLLSPSRHGERDKAIAKFAEALEAIYLQKLPPITSKDHRLDLSWRQLDSIAPFEPVVISASNLSMEISYLGRAMGSTYGFFQHIASAKLSEYRRRTRQFNRELAIHCRSLNDAYRQYKSINWLRLNVEDRLHAMNHPDARREQLRLTVSKPLSQSPKRLRVWARSVGVASFNRTLLSNIHSIYPALTWQTVAKIEAVRHRQRPRKRTSQRTGAVAPKVAPQSAPVEATTSQLLPELPGCEPPATAEPLVPNSQLTEEAPETESFPPPAAASGGLLGSLVTGIRSLASRFNHLTWGGIQSPPPKTPGYRGSSKVEDFATGNHKEVPPQFRSVENKKDNPAPQFSQDHVDDLDDSSPKQANRKKREPSSNGTRNKTIKTKDVSQTEQRRSYSTCLSGRGNLDQCTVQPVNFDRQKANGEPSAEKPLLPAKTQLPVNARPAGAEASSRSSLLLDSASNLASEPQFWNFNRHESSEGKKIVLHYCRSLTAAESVARLFSHDQVIGFDLEWKSQASKHDSLQDNISVIQIANEERIALFHLAVFNGARSVEDLVIPSLKNILEDAGITKVGVSIKADCTRLRKYLEINARGIFELSHLYKLLKHGQSNPELVNKRTVNLSDQVEEHLGLPLDKSDDVRCSDWTRPLNYRQVQYAASDPFACLILYHAMNKKRQALVPMPPLPAHADLDLPIRLAVG